VTSLEDIVVASVVTGELATAGAAGVVGIGIVAYQRGTVTRTWRR
jgi:hypothetical protein